MTRPPILQLPRNIVLIGFMGSGKTTVGRVLAERLRWPLVDTDHRIVENAGGRSIATLFTEEGEPEFRERESAAVTDVCSRVGQVISTGGGSIMRPQNVAALRSAGTVFWLTARPDVVVARTRRSARTRPLLAVGTAAATAAEDSAEEAAILERVLTLLSERGPLYKASCDLVVDTSDRTPVAIAAEIHRKAERWQPELREGRRR